MAGLTAGMIAYLRGSASPEERAVMWTSSEASGDKAGTVVAVTERFAGNSALFGHQVSVTAEQDEVLLPVSDAARGYFLLRDAQLFIDVLSEDGLRRVSRLEMLAGARRVVVHARRSIALTPGGANTARGAWIEGGYVTPTTVESSDMSGGSPVLVTRWAREHPEIKDSLLAWFEMGRFMASHRYFLAGAGGGGVRLVDFGETVSVTPPL
jgi:hypothetical protein